MSNKVLGAFCIYKKLGHKYLYIIPFSNFKFQNKSNSITSRQLVSEFFWKGWN